MVTRSFQFGVTYLWMLFLVFLLGLGLGKSLEVYSTVVQRERESELIYVGELYRDAIRSFYLSSPGAVKMYPSSLGELLKDPRSLTNRRYIRRLYPDPLTGRDFVPILAPEGGIWGVRSSSDGQPLRVSTEALKVSFLAVGQRYSGWEFIYKGSDNY